MDDWASDRILRQVAEHTVEVDGTGRELSLHWVSVISTEVLRPRRWGPCEPYRRPLGYLVIPRSADFSSLAAPRIPTLLAVDDPY